MHNDVPNDMPNDMLNDMPNDMPNVMHDDMHDDMCDDVQAINDLICLSGFLLLVSDFREFEVFSAMTVIFETYGVEGLFRENFPLLSKYIQGIYYFIQLPARLASKLCLFLSL